MGLEHTAASQCFWVKLPTKQATCNSPQAGGTALDVTAAMQLSNRCLSLPLHLSTVPCVKPSTKSKVRQPSCKRAPPQLHQHQRPRPCHCRPSPACRGSWALGSCQPCVQASCRGTACPSASSPAHAPSLVYQCGSSLGWCAANNRGQLVRASLRAKVPKC